MKMGKTRSSNNNSGSGGRLWWKGAVVPMMRKVLSCNWKKGVVKEGHFVVIATEGWKPERFFIQLEYLDDPDFVNLLKQAEEEFGFSQVGALAIPCQPEDLKRIIATKKAITC